MRCSMRSFASVGFALCVATLPLASQETRAPRFQSDINAFLKADSSSRPPAGEIELVGSSIFRLWKSVATDMAPMPVFNRAFGGSQTPDVLRYMDQIVIAYKPRIVVFYCGSNDVNAGAPASEIIARIEEFHHRLIAALPATKMIFVSVIHAPDKRNRWSAVDSVNLAMRLYSAESKQFEYVDVNPALEGPLGAPVSELYLPDSLHYRTDRDAYVRMTRVLKPVLLAAWTAK